MYVYIYIKTVQAAPSPRCARNQAPFQHLGGSLWTKSTGGSDCVRLLVTHCPAQRGT